MGSQRVPLVHNRCNAPAPDNDVGKPLAKANAVEERKQALIADLLKQRDAAIKGFDDKVAKLGWQSSGNAGKGKRGQHGKAAG